jgi:hypothetical protein
LLVLPEGRASDVAAGRVPGLAWQRQDQYGKCEPALSLSLRVSLEQEQAGIQPAQVFGGHIQLPLVLKSGRRRG